MKNRCNRYQVAQSALECELLDGSNGSTTGDYPSLTNVSLHRHHHTDFSCLSIEAGDNHSSDQQTVTTRMEEKAVGMSPTGEFKFKLPQQVWSGTYATETAHFAGRRMIVTNSDDDEFELYYLGLTRRDSRT
jgi:hypothetical protein